MKRTVIFALCAAALLFAGCKPAVKELPRGEASAELSAAADRFIGAAKKDLSWDIHSIMVLQHGKVLYEKWLGLGAPDEPHIMWSVSKTFTATAVGFAIEEGLLKLDDKLISFFPDDLPDKVTDNLAAMTVEHLLTMNTGHPGSIPTSGAAMEKGWEKYFLSQPVIHEPGTYFIYNSMASYMLSSIVQKVTGQKINDYLLPRLWKPLGIEQPRWDENGHGVNCGGWGLFLKTEDMARMGLCLLNNGKFDGKQVIPASWVEQMTTYKVPCQNAGATPEMVPDLEERNFMPDWREGYCYQMWRGAHNTVRADGAYGQYIILCPDKDAVIVLTDQAEDLQKILTLTWDEILAAL